MNSFSTDKGITFRQPSTANLMVDSSDIVSGAGVNPGSISFVSSQAFQNGFFTRVGVTEFILDFKIPNILGPDANGWQFNIDISGGASGVVCRVPNGFYNVSQLIDSVAAAMAAAGAGTMSVTQNTIAGRVNLVSTIGYRFSAAQPTTNLNGFTIARLFPLGGSIALSKPVNVAPVVTFLTYLDFVSNQLTYAQDLKDSNTSQTPYDVLLRYYFALSDEQMYLDKYGFPVPKGSCPFSERRTFAPPKQIRWDTNLPLGNFTIDILFQIGGFSTSPGPLTDYIATIGPLLSSMGLTKAGLLDYRFTLQLSEN